VRDEVNRGSTLIGRSAARSMAFNASRAAPDNRFCFPGAVWRRCGFSLSGRSQHTRPFLWGRGKEPFSFALPLESGFGKIIPLWKRLSS